MRPRPVQQIIHSADGFNRRRQIVAQQVRVTGNLNTLFYPEQANFLLTSWAITLNGSNDLPSCTVDHAIVGDDSSNTIQYRRYLGVKVQSLHLSAAMDSPLFRLNLGLVAQQPASPNITVTDFPEPAATLYPAEVPYTFSNLATPGLLSMYGVSRSEMASLDFSINNHLDAPLHESQYISRCKWVGREIDYNAKILYKTYTDRSSYEATTAGTNSIRIDNGTNHVIMTLEGQNYLTSVEDDLQLDKIFYETLSWANFYDQSVTTDIALTIV